MGYDLKGYMFLKFRLKIKLQFIACIIFQILFGTLVYGFENEDLLEFQKNRPVHEVISIKKPPHFKHEEIRKNNLSHRVLVADIGSGLDYLNPHLVKNTHFDLDTESNILGTGYDFVALDRWPLPYFFNQYIQAGSKASLRPNGPLPPEKNDYIQQFLILEEIVQLKNRDLLFKKIEKDRSQLSSLLNLNSLDPFNEKYVYESGTLRAGLVSQNRKEIGILPYRISTLSPKSEENYFESLKNAVLNAKKRNARIVIIDDSYFPLILERSNELNSSLRDLFNWNGKIRSLNKNKTKSDSDGNDEYSWAINRRDTLNESLLEEVVNKLNGRVIKKFGLNVTTEEFIFEKLRDLFEDNQEILFVFKLGSNSTLIDGKNRISIPCSMPNRNVLCVGTLTSEGLVTEESNLSFEDKFTIYASSENLMTTVPTGYCPSRILSKLFDHSAEFIENSYAIDSSNNKIINHQVKSKTNRDAVLLNYTFLLHTLDKECSFLKSGFKRISGPDVAISLVVNELALIFVTHPDASVSDAIQMLHQNSKLSVEGPFVLNKWIFPKSPIISNRLKYSVDEFETSNVYESKSQRVINLKKIDWENP